MDTLEVLETAAHLGRLETVAGVGARRGHDLGKVKDWGVLYFHRDDGQVRQRTVVTETRGPPAGRRVVREREADCRAYYAAAEVMAAGDG